MTVYGRLPGVRITVVGSTRIIETNDGGYTNIYLTRETGSVTTSHSKTGFGEAGLVMFHMVVLTTLKRQRRFHKAAQEFLMRYTGESASWDYVSSASSHSLTRGDGFCKNDDTGV